MTVPAAPVVEAGCADPLSIAVCAVSRMLDQLPDLRFYVGEVDVTVTARSGEVYLRADPKLSLAWRLT